MGGLEPEDIFSSSLETLYEYQPITLASAGSVYTYTSKCHPTGSTEPLKITLLTPNTLPANWSLHASDIWASSLYLADHLDQLDLGSIIDKKGSNKKVHLLELGAAAGLPGILTAKVYEGAIEVTVSDYPDEQLIATLSDNVARNGVSKSCRAVAYAWGSDVSPLFGERTGFDIIIAADTLWNPDLHGCFVESLRRTLERSPAARVHMVAGLHTGRYTIQSFLNVASNAGFDVVNVLEKEITGFHERSWNVARTDGGDETERRRWVVWITLRWKSS